MKHVFLVAFVFFATYTIAQNKPKSGDPVFHEVSNKLVVQSVFPLATKVEKVNAFWFKVVDDKNKVYGYAMASTPYCKDVVGYNNATPVMLITDKNFIIKKVELLSNYETMGYVKRLQRMGFFESWVDVKLKDAKSVKVDGYTGATITAKAIIKNVDFLLENGVKQLPKKQ